MISDSSPARGSLGPSAVKSSLDVVSSWVYSMQGTGEFSDSLERLMSLIKADAAILVRVEDGKHKRIAIVDSQTRKLFSPRDRPSLASSIFSDEISLARSGTVWLHSDAYDHVEIGNPDLNAKLKEFAVRDVAVVTLEATCRSSYYLEFHFSSLFLAHNRVVLLTLAGTLSKTWKDRSIGAARAIELSSRVTIELTADRLKTANILATDNPFGLSRCEFRVCLLIREGFTAKRLAKELNIKESTVRTHLSSIFAKAEVSGHIELLHRLSRGRGSGPLRRSSTI